MIISTQQVQSILKLQSSFVNKNRNLESIAVSKMDTLELSGRAQEMKLAKEMVLKSPEVRADKILELKKLIQEGNYQVSGNEIASKMINRSLVDELARR